MFVAALCRQRRSCNHQPRDARDWHGGGLGLWSFLPPSQPATVPRPPERVPHREPGMNDTDRTEALELLRSPDLLERIAADIELAGYVGEPRNKKLAYIIGTSRRLPRQAFGGDRGVTAPMRQIKQATKQTAEL